MKAYLIYLFVISAFLRFLFAFSRHANDVLKNETTMFEKYLKRVDPKDIGLQQASEYFLEFLQFPPKDNLYVSEIIYKCKAVALYQPYLD